MKKSAVACLLFGVLLAGCRSLDADKLVLNPQSQVYEAKHGGSMVPLRLKSGVLVDSTHFDNFRLELAARGNHYPFSVRKEPSVLLKRSDWTMATHFDAIHTAITNEAYNQVFAYARLIRAIYPQADLFTNLAFLEGYAFEQLGLNTEAKKRYTHFLNYSSQTYSALQRGYENADSKDSIYLDQRNAARQFVNGNRAMHVFEFPPIPPKHHVNPNQPGFLDNASFSSMKHLSLGVSLGRDYRDALSLGLRLSRPLLNKAQMVVLAEVSRNTATGTVGIPLQLYRTDNNNFGAKLSPFMTYSYRYGTPLNVDEVSHQRSYVNGGLQVSAGYFLIPNLLLGGVYTYNLRDLPYQTAHAGSQGQTNSLSQVGKNSYDLSLYWGLLDNLSLKAGVKNKDIVLGCFLSGWEISWSLNQQRLILTSNLF